MKKHDLRVNWSCGVTETYTFNSVEERIKWMSFREDDIDSATIIPRSNNMTLKALSTLDCNMTDYEMDVLL